MTLSRDAQVIAVTLFSLGKVCKVTFDVHHPLNSRAVAAFMELEQHGMIERIPHLYGWKATERIGRPMLDYARPTKQECFPLFGSEPTRH